MTQILLVDVNVLGIGSMRQYSYSDLTHRGRETGAIHGIAEKLAELADDLRQHVPVVLWDDRCRWREKLLPQYKRHRWSTPEQQAFLESYLWQAKVASKLLGHLGVPQVSCTGFEADDIAGAIVRHASPKWRIRLATTDRDWWQALRPNVDWQSTYSGQVVTLADLGNPNRAKDGPFHSVDHYVQAKALAGDTSDGIPGVRGVGVKTAARLIREHGSVEALWARHDAGEVLKGVILQRVAGPEYRDAYRRNLQLVDWRLAPPLGKGVRVNAGRPDRAAAARICKYWGLPRSTPDLPAWKPERMAAIVDPLKQVLARAAKLSSI